MTTELFVADQRTNNPPTPPVIEKFCGVGTSEVLDVVEDEEVATLLVLVVLLVVVEDEDEDVEAGMTAVFEVVLETAD